MTLPSFTFTGNGEQDAENLTKVLVKIESTDPGTYETGMEQFITSLLIKAGCTVYTQEVLPGRRNLMAELTGSSADAPALVFICHMDTVVAGDGWTMQPFAAIEKDGNIYGRGSCDMKSGLACALTAFLSTASTQTFMHTRPKHTLRFIASVDEEDFMRGSDIIAESDWITDKDYILDTEPTDGCIENAHKGRQWFEIEINGITAHASTPEQGADAVAGIAETICSIYKSIAALPSDPYMGKTTVTFGQITGGYRPYVVPDKAKVWIDMRIVPPFTPKSAEAVVISAIQNAEQAVPGIKGTYTITGSRPGIAPDSSSPLLSLLLESTKEICGTSAEIKVFPGYTDTAVIAGRTGNRNCMSYGPGKLIKAHKPDEYVAVADIHRVYCVLKKLIQKYIMPI